MCYLCQIRIQLYASISSVFNLTYSLLSYLTLTTYEKILKSSVNCFKNDQQMFLTLAVLITWFEWDPLICENGSRYFWAQYTRKPQYPTFRTSFQKCPTRPEIITYPLVHRVRYFDSYLDHIIAYCHLVTQFIFRRNISIYTSCLVINFYPVCENL